MGYAIQYTTGTAKKYPLKRKIRLHKKKTVLAVCGVIAVLAALMQISAVRRLLLPGDPVITERAIVKMVDELQAGEGLQEAVTAFCREVIQGGFAD